MIKFTKQGHILSALLLVVLFIRLVTWRATQNEMMFEMHYNGIKAIKSNNLDSSVLNSKWFNGTPNLVRESGNNLYISKNFGVDWEIKRELEKSTGFSYKEIQIDQIYLSERAYIFTHSDDNHQVYYTEDAGENWGIWDFKSVIKSTVEKYFFDIDPNMVKATVKYPTSSSSNKSYLIANIYFKVNKYNAHASFDYISTDFGKNWDLLSPFEDLALNESKKTIVSCNFDVEETEEYNPNKVFCSYYLDEVSHSKTFDFKSLATFYVSDNLGKSWTKTESLKDLNVNDVLKTKDYTLAYIKKNDFDSVDRYVFKESDKMNGMEIMANVLYGDSKSDDVKVLRERVVDDVVILNVLAVYKSKKANDNNDYPFRHDLLNTFISDTTGLKFYSFDEITGEDFQNTSKLVFSIPQFKDTLMMESKKPIDREPKDSDDNNIRIFNENSLPKYSKQATKISFDKGYSWSNIKVNPLDNALKDSITLPCDPSNQGECTFKSNNGFFQFAVSSYMNIELPATPGILSLNGMVSKTDISNSDDKNNYATFISRDGGHSFDARLNFSTEVAVGDHGNILVAISKSDDYRYSKNFGVYYSLDQGKTWEKYQFNINFFPSRITPSVKDGSGFHFLVSGEVYPQGSLNPFSLPNSEYMNIILDFSDIHGGVQCDEEKDMEIWELNNGECIDGLKHSFKRRKQFSKCSVNKLYEKSISETSVCECTEKDFECAPEFYRDFSTGKCVLGSNLLAELSEQKCKNFKDKKISIPTKILKSNNVCRNPESVNIDMQELTCDRLSL